MVYLHSTLHNVFRYIFNNPTKARQQKFINEFLNSTFQLNDHNNKEFEEEIQVERNSEVSVCTKLPDAGCHNISGALCSDLCIYNASMLYDGT